MNNGYCVLKLEHVLPNNVSEIKHWDIETRFDIPSSLKIEDAMFEYFKINADDYQFRIMKQKIADLESQNKFLSNENRRLENELSQW